MRNRLGCVSVAGILAAAVVLLVVLVWTIVAGPVLFNAGQLNAAAKSRTLGGVTSHAQLKNDCAACHTAPWSRQRMADKCLACHKDIGSQVETHAGLHGRLLGALSAPTCKGCHTEHHGPRASLTVKDGQAFPHDLTKFSLRGHREDGRGGHITCAQCHPTDLSRFDEASCDQCHAALNASFMRQHESRFGKKCLLCHDGRGQEGGSFDHNNVTFKLTGRHVGVACDRCHPVGSLQSAATTPRDCNACHAKDDKHKGAFGAQCDQCHTTAGWPGAKFDHTAFPVTHGREEQLATCKTCHPNDVSTYTCYGCHQHTVANVLAEHQGRKAADLANCIACHKGGQGGGG